MVSAVSTSDLNLDLCAQEPIRIPGSIQPHGTLVVVDPGSRRIVQASANARALLGTGRGSTVLGLSLIELVGESAARQIDAWLANPDSSYLRTLDINGQRLQVLGHQTAQGTIFEFEQPPASEGETLEAYYPRVGRFMEDLPACENIAELCAVAAREFRQISGFNRILIYRFDAEWNGEVLAEDGDGLLPSHAGQRFPASDIPTQARELYRLNRLRVIPDANYTPVPIEPPLDAGGVPLDLSFAALRSVSPVHLQYMRNMGTLASMSISVLVDGELWGLVSCHNALPRRVNAQARTACDLLGKVLSQHIGARERGSYAAKRIDLKRVESELLTKIAASDSFQSGLGAHAHTWLKIAGAAGAAVLHDDLSFTAGTTPPPDRLRALAEKLHQQGADFFVTDSLGQQWPEFSDILDVASGVLAISISQLHSNYILWFRPEVVRTVLWAGDPRAAKQVENEHLTPRNSFASWKELVKGRAVPWSQAEIDGALDFRIAIINFVLRRAEERAELTSQLQRSNLELKSFSDSVSHDLRAPFRHIVGYTQLLRDREQSLSAQSQHYLDSINEAAASAGQAETALHDLNQTLTLRVAHKTAERDHLWQLSKDLMAVMTPVGALIEVNPAWQASLGHGTSEVVGEHLAKFAHSDDASVVRQAVLQSAQESQRPFECRFVCRDGETRWVSWSTALGRGCIYAVGRDITEDKAAQVQLGEAQEALRQAQKMEAVGQLTGGLAHDFNNLLQIVVGNIETLQRKLPPSLDRLRRAADHAMAGAQRASNLTQHLLAFSRKQPLNPRPVAVNRLVAGMSEMIQRTLGEQILVETGLSMELRHVEIDSNQLEIALLNLAVNARDAMPDGGKLSIETFNLDLRNAPHATGEGLPRGEFVVINVRDTGTGMAPEVMARAFEPFFTTKSVGQGTGLGLSQVYGFVRQSGGQVRISSTNGNGTSIRIYLPAARPDAQLPEDDSQSETSFAAQRETILIVEDDPDVRAFTVETVRELGYDVLEARDGVNALNVLRQTPAGNIDLLFSDVVLPGGMNGQQLAQQAVVLHPQLKVLFATGYARDVIVHHGRLDPGVELITKPFAFDDLAARIRSVLDDQESARHAN